MRGKSLVDWDTLAPRFARMVGEFAEAGYGAVRTGRWSRHPCGGRLGSAGTRLRAGERGRLSARIRERWHRARQGGAHDRVQARRRCGPVPHYGKVSRACENYGRAIEEACGIAPSRALVSGRNRMADDDAARPVGESLAHHCCNLRRRRRWRRQHHGAAVHAGAGSAGPLMRAGSPATRNSS